MTDLDSVITQSLYFTSGSFYTEVGLLYMGLMIIACTMPVSLVYLLH